MTEPARSSSPLRITVFFFHPFIRRSVANRALVRAAQEVPGVEVRDMYEIYPDFAIDIAQEQSVLLRTDVLVLQHPYYWYNCPGLMKEWIDEVLEQGWAYGEGGDRLDGKHWLQVLTTGGPAEAYSRKGYHEFTTRELLRPFEQTARFCGMIPLEPMIVHSAGALKDGQLELAAAGYRELLSGLVAGRLPAEYSTRGAPPV